MAMTPEEQNKMQELERTVERLQRVEDTAFIESMYRRLENKFQTYINQELGALTIGSLSDVDLSGLSNNEILKYNSTSGKFEPAADEIGAA